MDAITQFVMEAAASPWLYLLVAAVCLIDAFFPPVPSETVVVGVAALAVSTGTPWLWLVIIVSAVGAIVGDNIAYAIGRGIGTTRFSWMRRPRIAVAFALARRGLDRRPASLILTARYIPVGRIAVNMTAGATRFPRRRFVPLSIIAGASWAAYSVAIGTLFGHWFHDNPLIGVVAAIACATVIGLTVDRVSQYVQSRKVSSPSESELTTTSRNGSELAVPTLEDSES